MGCRIPAGHLGASRRRRGAANAVSCLFAAVVLATARLAAAAPVVEPPFDAHYFLVDLGAITDVPLPYGGVTFVPGDPDTIVIAGHAGAEIGRLYAAGVRRDSTGTIAGFTAATPLADAYGVNGGLAYGPEGTLFYGRVTFEMGQVKAGSSTTDKVVNMRALFWPPSGIDFVPPGLGGEGQLKALTRNFGEWWSVTIAADGMGTYDVTGTAKGPSLPGYPQGFDYVAPGTLGFLSPGVVVSETELGYGEGKISAYDVDEHGDPIPSTRRVIVSGLDVPESVAIDTATGDVLFSSYVGKMLVLRSAPLPPTTSTSTTTTRPPTTSTSTTTTTRPPTTSTSTTTTTLPSTTTTTPALPTTTTWPTTSTTVPTTTSTTMGATTSSTTAPTTTTTLPSSCAAEPTFPSIACRVDALRALVSASTDLGPLQASFVARLQRAQAMVAAGMRQCTAHQPKAAGRALARLGKQMTRVHSRTRTLRARKTIPNALAERIGSAGQDVAVDARVLRDALGCS